MFSTKKCIIAEKIRQTVKKILSAGAERRAHVKRAFILANFLNNVNTHKIKPLGNIKSSVKFSKTTVLGLYERVTIVYQDKIQISE